MSAAVRPVQLLVSAQVMNSLIMRCATISSYQSAVTSEIESVVGHEWCEHRYSRDPNVYLSNNGKLRNASE